MIERYLSAPHLAGWTDRRSIIGGEMTGNGNSYWGVLAVLFGSVAAIGCSNDQGLPTVAEEAAFPTAAEEQAMMEENKRNAAKRGWGDSNLKPVEWPPRDAADPSDSESAADPHGPPSSEG